MGDAQAGANDELSFRLLRTIRQIIRQVSSHSRTMSRDTGLTVPQLLCMRAIRDLDGQNATLAAVSDAVHLSRSTVSGVVDRLVRGELVHRVRTAADRRRINLTLTPQGEARLDDMPRPLQDRFLSRLGRLPDAEQQALLEALERVVSLMGAEGLDAAPMLVDGVNMPTDGVGEAAGKDA